MKIAVIIIMVTVVLIGVLSVSNAMKQAKIKKVLQANGFIPSNTSEEVVDDTESNVEPPPTA